MTTPELKFSDEEIKHAITMQECKPFEDSDVEALKWAAGQYLKAKAEIQRLETAIEQFDCD